MNSAKNNYEQIGKRNKTLMLGEFVSDPQARQKLIKKGITEGLKYLMTKGASSAKTSLDYFKDYIKNKTA